MTNAIELVDKATSEYLIQLDWTIALQICDILNRDSIHARGVIRQILKRLKERSRVILLALELSDCLLQNCQCTHIYFAERTFQTEMARLIMNKKSKEPVKDKALELVDRWGKAFERRSDLSGFYDTYSFISRSGYRFPPRRPDAPVINFNNPPQSSQRKPSSGSMNQYSSTTPSSTTGSGNHANLAPPTNQEISSIKGSVSVFSEMISFLNVEDEDPSENDLIKELLETCKKSQTRIKEMIESGTTSERDLGSLLTLNDEVNRALNDYETCLKKRNAFVMNGYKPVQAPPQAQYQNNNNNNFNNSNNNRPNNNNSIISKHKELEEIDFFAAPDGVNPFALQSYQPQPQPQQQNQMMMNNQQQQQNVFNPFAPQQQQQQQQQNSFNSFSPQQQQRPADDFDLLISNRQSTQNPFSYNNNNNNNSNGIPATAKSLPQQNNFNRPFNPNTQTLPSAPPIFNSPQQQQQQQNNPFTNNNNNNNNMSPNNNNNMFANNNQMNNNNNNNNNVLALNNRPFPNYNAIRNDDPFSGGGFNQQQQQNMNPYGLNNNQQPPMMYNPMMQQQQQQPMQPMMMNQQQQQQNQNQNYSHFTQYANPNQPFMNNNQNQPTTKLW